MLGRGEGERHLYTLNKLTASVEERSEKTDGPNEARQQMAAAAATAAVSVGPPGETQR